MSKLDQLARNNELTETNFQEFIEDINSSYDDSFRALHWAITNGNSNIVKLLINKGVSPNIQVRKLYALHWAAVTDKSNICEILIDAGADFNRQSSDDGSTPLHLAIWYLDIVKLLIGKGADLNIQDNNKKTAYDVAIEYNCIDSVNAIRKELTSNLTEIYKDVQISIDKSPLFASHVNKSKLFNLNMDCLDQVSQRLDYHDIQSLKEAITIELCAKLKHNKESVSLTNTELHTDTELQPIGECSINDNA